MPGIGKTRLVRSLADVRDEARRVLPEHLVPQRLVLLDQLPLSTNGKLDRPRLPDPGRGGGAGAGIG